MTKRIGLGGVTDSNRNLSLAERRGNERIASRKEKKMKILNSPRLGERQAIREVKEFERSAKREGELHIRNDRSTLL